jgi:hypothetical protein
MRISVSLVVEAWDDLREPQQLFKELFVLIRSSKSANAKSAHRCEDANSSERHSEHPPSSVVCSRNMTAVLICG